MHNQNDGRITRQLRRARWLFALILVSVVMATPAFSQKTYYLDESTDFTGNGCENADLNTVTASLQGALNASGWSGPRYTNASAWPQDFYEASFGIGGLDSSYGDNYLLSVYAGHGNVNLLQFGFPHSGRCLVSISSQVRLGTLNGDRSGYMMYLTSCTMNLSGLSNLFVNQVHQQFGYHNSPSIGDDQPRDFFNDTDTMQNKFAWVFDMEDKPGWFTGDNSPIIMTLGVNSSDAAFKHDNAMLRAGSWLFPAAEPHTWYYYTIIDHGGC